MRSKTEMSWSFSSDGRSGNSREREILTEWQSSSMITSFKEFKKYNGAVLSVAV